MTLAAGPVAPASEGRRRAEVIRALKAAALGTALGLVLLLLARRTAR